MKCKLTTVLALLASVSAFAGDYYSSEGYEVIHNDRHHRDDNYTFNCKANATVQSGQEFYTHLISVDGVIDANNRTLGGEPVFVSVNDRGFAKYNLPQHSIWLKDGELLSLSLRGQTVKGEVLKFRYAGEGNIEQNRVELTKNRRSLSTNDISCTVSKTPW
jgi:hypothetical protein